MGEDERVLDKGLEDACARLAALTQFRNDGGRGPLAEPSPDVQVLTHQLVLAGKQMAAANADLESFSYSVAHDLRGPIRQIAGFSKILLEEYGPLLPEEGRRYVQQVEQGATHMGELVDDLLHLAQIGRQPLVLRQVSLNSILNEAMELLRAETVGRRIDWKIAELGDAACDRGLMRQVFVNLISNSVKYTRTREHAVIEVGLWDLTNGQAIFVRDNGVGFDMKYAGRLFGVFQRVHAASEFEGTGIGLATVDRIVRKHGGRIWAQARPDRGATFFFTTGAMQSPGEVPLLKAS